MKLTDLTPAHLGRVVTVTKGDPPAGTGSIRSTAGTGSVLAGVLASYELQWQSGEPHYAWLMLGGREHTFSQADLETVKIEFGTPA